MDSSVETISNALVELIAKEEQVKPDADSIFRANLLELVTEGREAMVAKDSQARYLVRVPRLEREAHEHVIVAKGTIGYYRCEDCLWTVPISADSRDVYPTCDGSVVVCGGTSVVLINERGMITLWSLERPYEHLYHRIKNERLGVSCAADGSQCAAFTVEGSALIIRLRCEAREQAALKHQRAVERLNAALALLRLN